MPRKRTPISRPNKQFFEFLDAVNSIHGARLPSYQQLFQKSLDVFEDEAKAHSQVTERVYLIAAKWPHLGSYLKKYCDQDSDADKNMVIATAYETFWRDRDLLLKLVRHSLASDGYLLKGESTAPIQVVVTLQGEFQSKAVAFEIFRGVDGRRLTLCIVCAKNIFWTARLDNRKYCSKECMNSFWQRKIKAESEEEKKSSNRVRRIKRERKKEDKK